MEERLGRWYMGQSVIEEEREREGGWDCLLFPVLNSQVSLQGT